MYSVLEQLLAERGLKVKDVSKATGVSPSTFTDWKAGRYTPKYEKLKKIADYFGVTVDYLAGDSDAVEAENRARQQAEISQQMLLLRHQLEAYYGSSETVLVAQEMRDNPELRLLFDAARDASPEDLRTVRDMLLILKKRGSSAETED